MNNDITLNKLVNVAIFVAILIVLLLKTAGLFGLAL